MKTLIIIVVVAVGGWFLLMFAVKGFARLFKKGAMKETQKALAGETIIITTDNASYLGADFPGPNLPPRTSGVLALTENKLFFMPWFPRKAITLPLKWINSVKTQDKYGEHAFTIPCLVIKVRDLKEGSEGKIAWLVHEPEEWRVAVESVLRN